MDHGDKKSAIRNSISNFDQGEGTKKLKLDTQNFIYSQHMFKCIPFLPSICSKRVQRKKIQQEEGFLINCSKMRRYAFFQITQSQYASPIDTIFQEFPEAEVIEI